MKILKICTSKSGGAAIAAIRQQNALNKKPNIKCDFLVAKILEEYTPEVSVEKNGNDIEILIPAIYWHQFGVINNALIDGNRTEISNTWFSYSIYKTDWDDYIFEIAVEYDVIHLHWVTQLISLDLINRLKAQGKIIVITSHDENYFTGGCHYTAGCTRYSKGCIGCLQLNMDELEISAANLENKQLTFSESGINWLFPSEWLKNQFKKSKIYSSENNAIVVRNTLDTNIYNVIDEKKKTELRNNLGIENADVVIVSGAQNNTELRKGFTYAEHAIKAIRAKNLESTEPLNIKVITFGHGGELPNGFGIRHIHLGFIDQEEIVNVLQVADLLLFTSTEENFSNLILESLACGCPVLGFNIGGIPDIVKDGVNGALVDLVGHESFTNRALKLVFGELKELRKSTEIWRSNEFQQYENSFIADQLIEIYKDSKYTKCVPNLADKFKFKSMFGINFNYPLVDAVVVGGQIQKFNKGELNFVYKGFVDFESNPEYGRVAWIKKNANVILRNEKSSNSVFIIICPYPKWNWHNIDVAFKNMQTRVNGMYEPVDLISDINKKFCAFVVDFSKTKDASSLADIEIEFKDSTVSTEQNSKGLCLLYSDLLVLNGSSLDAYSSSVEKLNYIELVALPARQSWQVNKYLEKSKNSYEEINKKILIATDLLLSTDK